MMEYCCLLVSVLCTTARHLKSLDNTLDKCNSSLGHQGLSTVVGIYNGEQGSCRDWLSALQKFGDFHNFNEAQRINAAKWVEDFITRCEGGTPTAQQKWDDLSAALLIHFAATIDSSLDFEM